MHFFFGDGSTKEFNNSSDFSKFVHDKFSKTNSIHNGMKWGYSRWLIKDISLIGEGLPSGSCISQSFSGYGGPYDFTDTTKGKGSLGSGRGNDPSNPGADPSYSKFAFTANCCIKKSCCIQGGSASLDIKCKVLWTLEDKYTYDDGPEIDKHGTDFWHVIHFYDDYSNNIIVRCR